MLDIARKRNMNRRERPGINIEKRGRTCSFDFSSIVKGLPKKTRQRVEAFLFLKKQRFENNYSAQLNVFKKKMLNWFFEKRAHGVACVNRRRPQFSTLIPCHWNT
jgi:hypothetical protein